MVLNRIKEKNTRFLATMIIIIISGIMINYGLSSLLSTYFINNTVDSAYMGVQLNLIITITVISIITVLMLILLPKQTVDELFKDISGGGARRMSSNDDDDNRTPEQQLQDMVDYNEELNSSSNKK